MERDLVQQCRERARAMGAFLAEVGQYKARGSGTTVGYPDLTLICSGKVVLIECKTPEGKLTPGQREFKRNAADQHVHVWVITSVDELTAIINLCRSTKDLSLRPSKGVG